MVFVMHKTPINDRTKSNFEQEESSYLLSVLIYIYIYMSRKLVVSESPKRIRENGHWNVLEVIIGLLNILEGYFYSAFLFFSPSSSGHHLY